MAFSVGEVSGVARAQTVTASAGLNTLKASRTLPFNLIM
jgi:hypothetical protein